MISGLFALDSNYLSFRITPLFEIATGRITEYVFDPNCKNTDNKISELDWNVSTIALAGFSADFEIIRYLHLGLQTKFGVGQRSDFMQDYDWLNSVTPAWQDEDPAENTNFSEHINKLDKAVDFKISAGGNLYLPLEMQLTPYLSYKYEFIRFTATGGYSEYKQNNYEKKQFEGNVISYEQEINTLLLGLNFQAKGIPRTRIMMDFAISPYLTSLKATDYHYLRNTAFRDSFKNLLQIESDLCAQYCFTKNHAAGIYGRIQYIPLSQGTTAYTSIDKQGNFLSDNWTDDESGFGGTERFIWSLGLNYSFSL